MNYVVALVRPLQFSASWFRKLGLATLGLLLFGLGQFEQLVFAVLAQAWQALLPGAGATAWGVVPGLSTHVLPVAVSYRLVYVAVSVLLLHVWLRGQAIIWIALMYASALALSVGLLLAGHVSGLALAPAAHHLLDLVSSPLALVLAYGIVTLGNRSFA
jgi:hypothetical protein